MIGALIVATVGTLGVGNPSAAPARAAEGSPRSAAQATPAGAGRWEEGTFANAAGSRRYKLYVPASYDPSRGTPGHMLVVLLHGCTQDPDDLARGTRVAEHAEREGFLALLPEQPASANPKKCWNWYDPAHQRRDAGEPASIVAVVRDVMATQKVDPARVYVAGISAGGAMAAIVGAAYPELFAAVGVHSGIAVGAATSVVEALSVMAKGPAAACGAGPFELGASRRYQGRVNPQQQLREACCAGWHRCATRSGARPRCG